MQGEFIKLAVIFVVIMGMVLMKRKLSEAMVVSILLTIVLFQIPIMEALKMAVHSVYEKDTLIVIGSFILVTFLQRIMEKRKLLERAELALQRLSGDRRLVCVIAPVVIGFLPSAGAVNICGSIVDKATGNDLDVEEKTFVTSYYRHISESFSPTYNAILLALSITSVATGKFVFVMLPLVIVLLILGYVFYLKKLTKGYGTGEVYSKKEEAKQLLYCFWPLLLCIILVISLNSSVLKVLPFVILLAIIVYKLSPGEIWEFTKTSFEMRIIVNTVILMIFKNILTYTGAIAKLPEAFGNMALPQFMAFGIIMFLGTIVSGANSMIVLLIPLAFASIPNAGAGLLVYLMALSYAAMQLSPTHICLAIITEYFKVSWGQLMKKSLPVIGIFVVIVNVYYVLISAIGIL